SNFPMSILRRREVFGACILTAATVFVFSHPAPAKEKRTMIQFNGTTYEHRWSKSGQNEFTPAGQEDLSKWTEMVTILDYDRVNNGEDLAGVANQVYANYQNAGKIIKVNSKPRTETAPAEHFIAAALGDPNYLELVFARLFIHDGKGAAVVVSHRIYGAKVGPAAGEWLEKNGASVEKALMEWKGLPTLAALRALPQSAN
ncbi:MAG TPA: hypothetical protein PK362_11290, partial [Elusimicrobiota bacterium]|nr:hypothetical protein [Elusimicrobiota bacterium]